jgi:hypothetical protein
MYAGTTVAGYEESPPRFADYLPGVPWRTMSKTKGRMHKIVISARHREVVTVLHLVGVRWKDRDVI